MHYLIIRHDSDPSGQSERIRLYYINLGHEFPHKSLVFCHDKTMDESATWEWEHHFLIIHGYLETILIKYDSSCTYEEIPLFIPHNGDTGIINLRFNMPPNWPAQPGEPISEYNSSTRQRED